MGCGASNHVKYFGGSLEEIWFAEGEQVPQLVQACSKAIFEVAKGQRDLFRMPHTGYHLSSDEAQLPKHSKLLEDPLYRDTRARVIQHKKDANKGRLDLNVLVQEPYPVLSWLLMDFFRELREPLLTYSLFTPFIRAQQHESRLERIVGLRSAIFALPDCHRQTLQLIVAFFAAIVANQRSVEGGLTNQDMGALFGRIFLRNRLDKATAGKRFHMLQSAVPHVDRVVTTMLLDFKEVFTTTNAAHMRELNQEIEGLHEAKEAEHHQACRALGLSVGMVLRYRHITSHTRNMDIKRRMFANWRRFVEEKEGRYTVYERLRLLNALLSEAQHDRALLEARLVEAERELEATKFRERLNGYAPRAPLQAIEAPPSLPPAKSVAPSAYRSGSQSWRSASMQTTGRRPRSPRAQSPRSATRKRRTPSRRQRDAAQTAVSELGSVLNSTALEFAPPHVADDDLRRMVELAERDAKLAAELLQQADGGVAEPRAASPPVGTRHATTVPQLRITQGEQGDRPSNQPSHHARAVVVRRDARDARNGSGSAAHGGRSSQRAAPQTAREAVVSVRPVPGMPPQQQATQAAADGEARGHTHRRGGRGPATSSPGLRFEPR